MAKPFANSGGSDQPLHSAVSDLGLHCLPITLLGISRLQWVNPIQNLFIEHHFNKADNKKENANTTHDFVWFEVLQPSQPSGVMSNALSLLNHTFTGQA